MKTRKGLNTRKGLKHRKIGKSRKGKRVKRRTKKTLQKNIGKQRRISH